jgi:hypothetical protein
MVKQRGQNRRHKTWKKRRKKKKEIKFELKLEEFGCNWVTVLLIKIST